MEILLIKDLCARLPYETYIEIIDKDGNVYDEVELGPEHINTARYDESTSIRPYLRPMSSMTEEEIKTYRTLQDTACSYHYEFGDIVDDFLYFDNDVSLDYLNSIHIDYRGLIEKGLALEAPKDMYKLVM
jgi:hypothetical protein